jgi:GNAT superfamily N-acetyltransferase
LGVIPRAGFGDGLGAAWLRFGGADGLHKLENKKVPQLATADISQARRRGVGSILIKHLIELARLCYPQILRSVREEIPAVLFYFRLGFPEVSRMKNRFGGNSLVMAIALGRATQLLEPVDEIQNA